VRALESELTETASALSAARNELRSREDSSTRLQSTLREREQLAIEAEERINKLRGERAALESSVHERESTIVRLEGELRSSAVVIDSIQRDIERIGGPGPGRRRGRVRGSARGIGCDRSCGPRDAAHDPCRQRHGSRARHQQER